MYRVFDVETTGFDYYGSDTIFSFVITDLRGNSNIYRLDGKRNYNAKEAEKVLIAFWLDPSIKKIMHNAKFDLSFVIVYLKKKKIKIPRNTVIHDTMMMSRLLKNLAPSHKLDYLCWEYAGISNKLDKLVKSQADAVGGFQNIPVHTMDKYQNSDGERGALLFLTFWPYIWTNKKLHKDYLVEIELIWVTQRIEEHGILVDKKNCKKLINWLLDELDNTRDDVRNLMGEFINLNSGISVARILYKQLGLPVLKLTDTGGPSTDKDTLAQLREEHDHPILDLIIKTRSYTNGISMIKSYLKFADSKGYIHPNINTNPAKTGRESSHNPNLLNVSKTEALLNLFPVPARKAFCAPPDSVLFLGDYSGIELRLIIELCNDTELLDMISQNIDVHDVFCQYWFHALGYKNLKDKIQKKIFRGAGKNGNFALAYGAAVYKLAVTLGLSLSEAIEGYKRICDRFPKIAYFTKNLVQVIRDQGYVTTPFGRKLYIPPDKIFSGSNYLVQGTAAGIIKRAQNKVDKYCRIVVKDDVRIVIPIYDELILKYRKKLLNKKNRVLTDISRLMTNIPEIKVKLNVDWKMTETDWASAKEVAI